MKSNLARNAEAPNAFPLAIPGQECNSAVTTLGNPVFRARYMRKPAGIVLFILGFLSIIGTAMPPLEGTKETRAGTYVMSGAFVILGLWLAFGKEKEEKRHTRQSLKAEEQKNLRTAASWMILFSILFLAPSILYAYLASLHSMTDVAFKGDMKYAMAIPMGIGLILLCGGILVFMRDRGGKHLFYLLSPIAIWFPIGTGIFIVVHKYFKRGNTDTNLNQGGWLSFLLGLIICPMFAYYVMGASGQKGAIADLVNPKPKSPVAVATVPKPSPAAPSTTAVASSNTAIAPAKNIFAGTEAAQKEAFTVYPTLTQKGSPLQLKFAERVKYYLTNQPSYFDDKAWPLTLAHEVGKEDVAAE